MRETENADLKLRTKSEQFQAGMLLTIKNIQTPLFTTDQKRKNKKIIWKARRENMGIFSVCAIMQMNHIAHIKKDNEGQFST